MGLLCVPCCIPVYTSQGAICCLEKRECCLILCVGSEITSTLFSANLLQSPTFYLHTLSFLHLSLEKLLANNFFFLIIFLILQGNSILTQPALPTASYSQRMISPALLQTPTAEPFSSESHFSSSSTSQETVLCESGAKSGEVSIFPCWKQTSGSFPEELSSSLDGFGIV